MDRGTSWATVHGVAKSHILLSDYTHIIVYLWVLEETQHCFPHVPHHFAFHQQYKRVPFSLHPYENLLHFVLFLKMVILTGWGWYLTVLLILISLMINSSVPFCIHAGLVFVFFGEIYIQVLCSFLNLVLFFFIAFLFFYFFFIVVDFVIHWNESAMGLHVFPILIPPPTSLSTRSL